MNSEAMVTTLKSLKLFGMAQTLADLAAQSSPAFGQAQAVLDSLLQAEVAEREVRSINYQMQAARFPAYRDLTGFDFRQSSVDEALIRTPHRGEFIEDAQGLCSVRERHQVALLQAQHFTSGARAMGDAPRTRCRLQRGEYIVGVGVGEVDHTFFLDQMFGLGQ